MELENNPEYTLVIPDIHNRVDWIEEFIIQQNPVETIFLGDYFDDFGDQDRNIIKAATWLKQSLEKPNRIHLLGNHDIAYLFTRHSTRFCCSGWQFYKQQIIDDILGKDWYKQCKLFTIKNGYCLSHAGFHIYNLGFTPSFDDIQVLEEICYNAILHAEHGTMDKLFEVGQTRGAYGGVGGITWMDWYDFKDIQGFPQIVGHTPSSTVKQKGSSYCIDTHNRHFAKISKSITIFGECDPTLMEIK